MLGLPLYTGIVGPHLAAMNVAIGNIITGLTIVPVTMAVLASTVPGAAKNPSIARLVWRAISPPLVWLPILGFALPHMGVSHLPIVLSSTFKFIGAANAGLGLICMGLILCQQRFSFNRTVGAEVLLKMVAMPLVMLGLAGLFGIGGPARLALILVALTPTASSMATITAEYHAGSPDASATVLLTTLLSLIAFPAAQTAFS